MFEWKDKLLAAAKIAVGVQYPVLSFFFDDIDDLFRGLSAITLSDFVSRFSNRVDELIVRIEHEERLSFIGGTIEASCSNVVQDEVFILHLKLYFQNQAKEFILKESSKNFSFNKLDITSKQRLITQRKVSYQIQKPIV